MSGNDDRRAWWAGLSGVLGALAWITGDILIIGREVDPGDYPLLFSTHADRIQADFAVHLLGAPTSQLIAGALCATFAVPLYLFGTRHLWWGLRPAGRGWAVPATALLFVGFAWSPLPHAAFYFLGATYQAVLAAPPQGHDALLALADEFHRVLLWTWYPAVLCSAVGFVWCSLAIATGRTRYPRWMALTCNPVVLALALFALHRMLPETPSHWLGSASLNIVCLLVFAQALRFGRPDAAGAGGKA